MLSQNTPSAVISLIRVTRNRYNGDSAPNVEHKTGIYNQTQRARITADITSLGSIIIYLYFYLICITNL